MESLREEGAAQLALVSEVGPDEADLASALKLLVEHTGTIDPHQLPSTHVIGIPKGE